MHDTAPAAKAAAWLAISARRSTGATSPRRSICSPTTATGATSSPSPGTSRRWRARPPSRRCSRRRWRRRGPRPGRSPALQRSGSEPIQAWFSFATGVGQGSGIFTLEGGKCRTILTTLQSLDGHEEAAGADAPDGRAPRRRPQPHDLGGAPGARGGRLGNGGEPYCLVIGGGQGGIMLGARLKQLGVPTRDRREEREGRGFLAQPLSLARAARPGLVRPPALHPLPRQLAGLHAQGQDGRLAGDVRQGDGAELLGRHRMRLGKLRRAARSAGPSSCRPRRQAGHAAARRSWSSPPAPMARRD